MEKDRFKYLKKFGFEFLSIFVAVISAFSLNNWNENRKATNSEKNILLEISNGLKKDLMDIKLNKSGHEIGIKACKYYQEAISKPNDLHDSIGYYYGFLTRDFISIQNTAAYETLKSKGLELIQDDSLRLHIISLYEYEYQVLRKLEEDYAEMQYHSNYFNEINKKIAPNLFFDEKNNFFIKSKHPFVISETDKNELQMILWNIKMNRMFALSYYSNIEKKIDKVQKELEKELKK